MLPWNILTGIHSHSRWRSLVPDNGVTSSMASFISDKDSTVDNGGQRVSHDGKLSKVRSSASVKNLTGIFTSQWCFHSLLAEPPKTLSLLTTMVFTLTVKQATKVLLSILASSSSSSHHLLHNDGNSLHDGLTSQWCYDWLSGSACSSWQWWHNGSLDGECCSMTLHAYNSLLLVSICSLCFWISLIWVGLILNTILLVPCMGFLLCHLPGPLSFWWHQQPVPVDVCLSACFATPTSVDATWN
jgi:hypothetical protein